MNPNALLNSRLENILLSLKKAKLLQQLQLQFYTRANKTTSRKEILKDAQRKLKENKKEEEESKKEDNDTEELEEEMTLDKEKE